MFAQFRQDTFPGALIPLLGPAPFAVYLIVGIPYLMPHWWLGSTEKGWVGHTTNARVLLVCKQ